MSLGTQIVLKNINGTTKATTVKNQKPIKILSPKSHPQHCHLTTTNYGGGFVQGDTVFINIKAHKNTTCVLTSQANNRVYKSENGQQCAVHQHIELEDNTLFYQLNDPLVLQKDSSIKQTLYCSLPVESNFILLDWISSGRVFSNENVEFHDFYSKTEIVYNGKKIVLDKLVLNPSKNNCFSPALLFNHTSFINLYLIGHPAKINEIQEHVNHILTNWLKIETKPQPRFVASIDSINQNLYILRASATETLILWKFVKEISSVFAKENQLEFNPYERKY